MAGEWRRVAAEADIDPEEPLQVKVGEELIGLYKVDGSVYALHDICTHAFACMTDGFLEGEEIECPLHQGRFNVKTGKALCPPVNIDLKTYPTKVENGEVFIQFDG